MLPFFEHYITEYKMAIASANLQSFDYDDEWETLTVYFRSGGVYRYEDVPEDVIDELKFAESRGRYFWEHIRTAYPFTILRHSRPGFVNAHNVAKTSTPQRHRLKTFASAPWKG